MYPSEGDVLEGKYRIDRMLGEGGMGAVFRATHLVRRAQVALKFMSPAAAAMPEAVDRFRNEAVSASEIDSSNVVKIFDVGQWGSLPYLVMEYLEGQDLAAEIARCVEQRRYMEVPRAVHFTLQVLRALQIAHGKGIVHRDLKPANAFVVEHDGEPDFVKLLDFGISKKRSGGDGVHLTKTNVTMGTPLYMSPEQARSARDADARSDLYSVAAILYELLTLQPPFPADDLTALIGKLLLEEPPPPNTIRPDVPAELSAVIVRGLAKNPDARFQTAVDLAQALAPFADARSGSVLGRLTTTGRLSAVPGIVAAVQARSTTGNTALAFGSGTNPAQPVAESPRKKSPAVGLAIGALIGLVVLGGVGFVAFGRGAGEKTGQASAGHEEAETPAKPKPAKSAEKAIDEAAKPAETQAAAPTESVSAAPTMSAKPAPVAAPVQIAKAPPAAPAKTQGAPAPTAAPAKPRGEQLGTMRPDD